MLYYHYSTQVFQEFITVGSVGYTTFKKARRLRTSLGLPQSCDSLNRFTFKKGTVSSTQGYSMVGE